jgi:hypothetical protein
MVVRRSHSGARPWTSRRPGLAIALGLAWLVLPHSPPMASAPTTVHGSLNAPIRSVLAVGATAVPLPPSDVDHIDLVAPVPEERWPKSRHPVAGMAFVSCTHLWTALPDGRGKRRVLEMDGISSPTFSPDGRAIAFLRSSARGQEIWLTAADGSGVLRVGSLLEDGRPVPDSAVSLAWSPAGGRIALALFRPAEDLSHGGSVVWVLDLSTGSFERVAEGWPVPFWLGRGLTVASWSRGYSGPRFDVTSGPGWLQEEASRLSVSEDYRALTAGLVPQTRFPWAPATAGLTMALLRRGTDGRVELAVKANPWSNRKARVVEPPPGFGIADLARLAVTQDGSRVLVDLVDLRDHLVDLRNGEQRPVLGIVDPGTADWTVLPYSWHPAASPIPVVVGPLGAQRAVSTAIDLLQYWNRFPDRRATILVGRKDSLLLPFRSISFVVDPPHRGERGWDVPAFAFGPGPDGFGYRQLVIHVESERGRLTAEPRAASPVRSIRTVGDALAFLGAALRVDVPPSDALPAGATLARRPVDVYGNGRETRTGDLYLKVPSAGEAEHDLLIQFGRSWFTLGCGGVEGDPIQVGESPALLGRFESNRQVIWPATPARPEGVFGVYGRLPTRTLLAIAEEIEAAQ